MFKQPPKNWMKILSVDPGTTRSGALFAAIPGPPDGVEPVDYRPSRIHFYGELMLYNATADMMAERVQEMHGPTRFHAFIMDSKCGRQHPPGFDISIFEQYSRSFRRHGLCSASTKYKFEPGTPDVDGRELKLKEWMQGADPILRVHNHLKNYNDQVINFFKKRNDPTKRETNKTTELIDTAEYIAGYFHRGLFWVDPEPMPDERRPDTSIDILKDLQNSKWHVSEAVLRAKIRHGEQRLIECIQTVEGEYPGEPGDRMWFSKTHPIPAGWILVDSNEHTRKEYADALDILRKRRSWANMG